MYTVSGTGSTGSVGISSAHLSNIQPGKMWSFGFTQQLLLQGEQQNTISPCHGHGEATKSLNVLLILMKTS
jgi:hypothetical protein